MFSVSSGAAKPHTFMSIPKNIEMFPPWQAILDLPNENRAELLAAELVAELPPSHVLYGLKARAVAVRSDRDDVLFEVDGGETPLAVVHLTWRKETDPRWPGTVLFRSWEQWLRDEMLPAHQDFS